MGQTVVPNVRLLFNRIVNARYQTIEYHRPPTCSPDPIPHRSWQLERRAEGAPHIPEALPYSAHSPKYENPYDIRNAVPNSYRPALACSSARRRYEGVLAGFTEEGPGGRAGPSTFSIHFCDWVAALYAGSLPSTTLDCASCRIVCSCRIV